MTTDLDAAIRAKLADRPALAAHELPGDRARDVNGWMSSARAAIEAVLDKHSHRRASGTLGYPHDFGCGTCHTWMRGSKDVQGLGWCETVRDIAKALGIGVDRD